MSLDALLSIVLPVFGFIALGYLLIRTRLLEQDVGDALGNFVFTIAIPCLLFRALGTLALPEVSPWPFWGTYFFAVAINVVAGIVLTERAFGRDARAGVIGGMSASYSNLVMVGVPVVTQGFGEEGQVTVFVLIAIHLPVMMAVSAFLIEIAEWRDGTAAGRLHILAAMGRVLRSLIRNPLIVAIIAGVAFRLTGLPLTGIPRTLIDRIADTGIPLALISLGMSLVKYGIRGNVLPAIALSATKLLLMPALVYLVAVHLVQLPAVPAAVLVIGASCPTGVNAYLMAVRFQTGLALSANTITITTRRLDPHLHDVAVHLRGVTRKARAAARISPALVPFSRNAFRLSAPFDFDSLRPSGP